MTAGGASPGGDHPLVADLLLIAPHVAWGARGVVWIDARGLAAHGVARAACDLVRGHGAAGVRAGIAAVAVAAEVAARHCHASPLMMVPAGEEPAFLAPFPIGVLAPEPHLEVALATVGIERCGDLAALTREAVEARLGPEGSALWRLARGDDARLLFASRPRALPSASVAWEEYTLRSPDRLIFPANALLGAVCAGLRERGSAARQLTLTLMLANRGTIGRALRAARATADRALWLRLVRRELERLTTLPDAVTGLALRVETDSASEALQGGLFDQGFQSAEAAEAALAQLVDDGDAVVVGLAGDSHPLVEQRTRWEARLVTGALRARGAGGAERVGVGRERTREGTPAPWGGPPNAQDRLGAHRVHHRAAADHTVPTLVPHLSLQLLPIPHPITVNTVVRRGLRVPARYQSAGPVAPGQPEAAELGVVAGPDVVSGGREAGAPYAREYFQCLTSDGVLVLLFRDLRAEPARGAEGGAWYLHGWWD